MSASCRQGTSTPRLLLIMSFAEFKFIHGVAFAMLFRPVSAKPPYIRKYHRGKTKVGTCIEAGISPRSTTSRRDRPAPGIKAAICRHPSYLPTVNPRVITLSALIRHHVSCALLYPCVKTTGQPLSSGKVDSLPHIPPVVIANSSNHNPAYS